MEDLRVLLACLSKALKINSTELETAFFEGEGEEKKLKSKADVQAFIDSTLTNYADQVGGNTTEEIEKKIKAAEDAKAGETKRKTLEFVEKTLSEKFGEPVAKFESLVNTIHAKREKPIEITNELILEKINANPDLVTGSEVYKNITKDLNEKITDLNSKVENHEKEKAVSSKRTALGEKLSPFKELYGIEGKTNENTFQDLVLPTFMKGYDFDYSAEGEIVKSYKIVNGERQLVKGSTGLPAEFSEVVKPILGKYFVEVDAKPGGGAPVGGNPPPNGNPSDSLKGMSSEDFTKKYNSMPEGEEKIKFEDDYVAANKAV